MTRKIAAHYTLIDGQLRRNIIVSVDSNRQITAIEECSTLDSSAGVEFYPGILIPGMVNAHCHLELSYLHGTIAEKSGFAGFARAIGSVRNNYSLDERIHAASVADSKMWAEGIEAVIDIANDDLVMPVKNASKIEYLTLFEVFGLTTKDVDIQQQMVDRWAMSSITPHSTYSLQDNIFRSAVAANDSAISLHLLESSAEIELYQKQGPLWQWYERMGWECNFLHYASPTNRIVESIPHNKRLILAHGCMATEADVQRLNNHFTTPVAWVLCPESNRYISDIKPPVKMFRSVGAHLTIGTDSLASARSLSLLDNLRLIEGVALDEMLTWATKNGAEAIGLSTKLGTIEVGKTPGLVVIEQADLHNLRLTPESITRRIL